MFDKSYTDKYADELSKLKVRCSCGHKVIIPLFVDKQICSWCGKYVFRDKHKEFNYRVIEFIKKLGGKVDVRKIS